MMGGGFGGCTINLVQEDAIDDLVEKITKEYKDATTLDLTAYVAETENGSALV
jgi:galactokinase